MKTRTLVGVLTATITFVVMAVGFASATWGASLPSEIAYKVGDYGGNDGIFVVSQGHPSTARPIVGVSKSAGGLGSPAWSPNGDVLAFEHNGNGLTFYSRSGHSLFTEAIPQRSPQGRIGGGEDIAWSPDGREIAYVCYVGHLLTVEYPPISIAFPAAPQYYPNLCVHSIVTGDTRVAAQSSLADAVTGPAVSWSSDGSMIAVDSQTEVLPSGDHYCVDEKTSATIQPNPSGAPCDVPFVSIAHVGSGSITPIGTSFSYSAAFSHRGSEIAFENSVQNPNASRLETMSASGGDIRQVIGLAGTIKAEPTWSPNDKEIGYAAFNRNGDGGEGLYSIDPNGAALTKLTSFSIFATKWVSSPSWVQPLTLCTVPSLKGQTLVAAKRKIQLAGCSVGAITGTRSKLSKRHVVKQSPAPNRTVAAGTKVNIRLG